MCPRQQFVEDLLPECKIVDLGAMYAAFHGMRLAGEAPIGPQEIMVRYDVFCEVASKFPSPLPDDDFNLTSWLAEGELLRSLRFNAMDDTMENDDDISDKLPEADDDIDKLADNDKKD